MGIASLVLGIISIVTGATCGAYSWSGIVLGVVGLILGILGKNKGLKGAKAGFICSIVGICLSGTFTIACNACGSSTLSF